MAVAEPITAQLDNSTITEENYGLVGEPANGALVLLFLVAVFSIGIALRKKNRKIRKVITLIMLFVSIVPFVDSLPSRSSNATNVDSIALAIFLVIIALLIAFVTRIYRAKKTIPWIKHMGIRRQFPIQIRDQVLQFPTQIRDQALKAQQHECANCGLSISPPLVHYDHIDGCRY